VSGFRYGIAFLLHMEGGYVADLGDGAGETHFGITKRSYPDLDIKTLSEDQAIAIYSRDYYDAINLHLLPAPVAVCMLDAAANHGAVTAVRLLQEALGVRVDGVLGPVTAQAATAPDAVRRLCLARAQRYAQNANFYKFGAGWMRRLFDCYAYCQGVPR
jgi:lysozyme family protein